MIHACNSQESDHLLPGVGLALFWLFGEGFVVIDNRSDGTHELEPKLSERLHVFHLKSGVLLNAKTNNNPDILIENIIGLQDYWDVLSISVLLRLSFKL
ncbi:hypothetical protein CDAR_82281 [Caerostris darwini]|uniref:Uncharacterized protein n=1 Tax=Caerostris darwini TaxID=1538125 RepID=A0AAV4Q9J5_9ARAC|nr:hypothetical protein CDAR_82281 [Caerostris darwini]